MPEFSYIIATWILIAVTLIFGIYFLALPVQKKFSLQNYHIARYVMACAYLNFGILTLIEFFTHTDHIDSQLLRFLTLFIALSQAFLFTYTLVTLST